MLKFIVDYKMWCLNWSHFRAPKEAKCLHYVLRSRYCWGGQALQFKGNTSWRFCSLWVLCFFVYLSHKSIAPLSLSCKPTPYSGLFSLLRRFKFTLHPQGSVANWFVSLSHKRLNVPVERGKILHHLQHLGAQIASFMRPKCKVHTRINSRVASRGYPYS